MFHEGRFSFSSSQSSQQTFAQRSLPQALKLPRGRRDFTDASLRVVRYLGKGWVKAKVNNDVQYKEDDRELGTLNTGHSPEVGEDKSVGTRM